MITEKIANELGVVPSQIATIIRSADKRYKTYQIPKRTGGTRIISQPSKKLKYIQRWLVKNVFNELPVHENAKAYVRGSSIAQNAAAHVSSRYILKTDFENFFPSLMSHDVERLLLENLGRCKEVGIEDVEVISKAVCLNDCLSIGAPSSPILSNCILYEFDMEITRYCKENNLQYTRYADDITISSREKGQLDNALSELTKLVDVTVSPSLIINRKKTVFVSMKKRRAVTGLVLTTEGKVSIGRDKKREVSSLVNRYRNDNLSDEMRGHLKGWLAYIHSVEPKFIDSLKRKYGEEVLSELVRGNLERDSVAALAGNDDAVDSD